MPQAPYLVDGSVRENIAFGFDPESVDDRDVWEALDLAGLHELFQAKQGLFTEVGENGSKLSGGQKQRLGIARAVFNKPKLLILDEVTSALDAETENRIADSIEKIRGFTTIINIAHRLSSVRKADLVVYLADGTIVSKGTFEEVREQVPDFDRQAKLMGLES
jgi:ABC-type multidrug transport system fused ATPase/permease subunit